MGASKVGDRILIAQDLDPPLPNCTCSLSPHTALTESPTLFTVAGASTSVRSYDSSKSTSHGWSRFPRTLPAPKGRYYDSSVTLALTSCRSSPSYSRRLVSCFRWPFCLFPLLAGWSQWELWKEVPAFPPTLSTGDHIVSCGLPCFPHD